MASALQQLTPFRLALITDTFAPQMNGVSRTLERLVTEVHARGGETLTITTTDPEAGTDPAIQRYDSVRFWAYPQLRIAFPSRADVTRRLTAFGPTLIHVATPFGVGLAGRAAASALNIPLVTSYHTSFSAYASYYGMGALHAPGWAFFRWFHNKGLRTYCPTHAIKAELEQQRFERVSVWGRGIDQQRFSPQYRSSALRESLGIDEDTLLIGYVGRIAPEKGIDVLLDAIPRVVAQLGKKVHFVFVGDGPYETSCRARHLPNTTFAGRKTGVDLSELYASLDLFLFPSTTDTFGNVLLEAAASGVAIVAADVPPTRELFGAMGAELVAPGRANAMADAIVRLAAAPDRRATLAHAALITARARTWKNVFDTLFADYADVISEYGRTMLPHQAVAI